MISYKRDSSAVLMAQKNRLLQLHTVKNSVSLVTITLKYISLQTTVSGCLFLSKKENIAHTSVMIQRTQGIGKVWTSCVQLVGGHVIELLG